MSKEQSPPAMGGSIVVWLIAAVIAANLAFSIFIVARVNRLHNFFNTFSEDYRSLNVQAREPSEPPIAGAGSGGNDGNSGGGDGGAGGKQCVSIDIEQGTDPVLGQSNAPVTIVEYSDFECPFCARFFNDTYGRLKSEYVDSGQVRLIYKDFPLDNIHPLATPAALVANCVAQELGDEAFFDMHDTIFAQQTSLSRGNLTQWAGALGLSADKVESCLNDNALSEEILADIDEAISAGINGTPSFIINGELLVGAQPFQSFKQAIDDALEGRGCSG